MTKQLMVPVELTAENGAKAALSGEIQDEYAVIQCACCDDGVYKGSPCEVCEGKGYVCHTHTVSWTAIKETWRKAIEVVGVAAPQVESEPVDIDVFALDLMNKVWVIGNRHGPDAQRKAQIQVAITEAIGRYFSAPQVESEISHD